MRSTTPLPIVSRNREELVVMHVSNGIGVAILAAGNSSRMGASKLSIPFSETTLLERSLQAAAKSNANQVVVITGSHQAEISPIVARCSSAIEIHNANWGQGQSTSVALAVEHAIQADYKALVVMVADQPFVQAKHLNSLISSYRIFRPRACVSCVGARDGSPCLFDSDSFDELLSLKGDKGARSVYRQWPSEWVRYVTFDDANLFFDIDTPDDMSHYKKMVNCGQ